MTTITITAAHIACGQRCSTHDCPVALAIRDAFPEARFVSVGVTTARITGADGKERHLQVPEALQRAIAHFDCTSHMEPQMFILLDA